MIDLSKTNLKVTLCSTPGDAEALRAAGLRSVLVVSDLEGMYSTGLSGQFELSEHLAKFDKYVLAFNADEHEKRDAVAMRLGDTACQFIEWPDDLHGPNEFRSRGTADDLRSVLANSKPMWIDEVCLLDDVPDGVLDEGFKTGFPLLDDSSADQFGRRFFRLVRPAFMPVVGPYGSGKSVLLRQLACNLWRLHGWRTLLTAFEEKIKPRYIRDLRRHLITRQPERGASGVEYSAQNDFDEADVKRADAEINQAFRFLRRKRGTLMDADRLIDRIIYAVEVYGVDVVIVDPVNEIDHRVPRGMSKTDYMGDFIMRLKQVADDYKILMIVAAHPPKEGVATRNMAGKIYTLNDGADTAHYGNKADIGWAVWRPSGVGGTFLNIDKCKDTEVMGIPTYARLTFVNGGFRVDDVGNSVLQALSGDNAED